MFTQIGTLLKSLPRRSKTPDIIVALHVRRAFESALMKLCADLPADVRDAVRAHTFKNHVLTVKCPTLTAGELVLRSGGLLKDINETLGRKIVYKLRFKNF